MIDNQCFVRVFQPDGKVKKTVVERKAYTRISKDLNACFYAKYFGGEPTDALFFIEDARTKKTKTFTSTIVDGWKWNFEYRTKYGLVKVECN